MTNYSMTPIESGTRVRDQPNTAGKELTRVNVGVVVTGSELFTAPVNLSNASGTYQLVGDKWLKISYNGVIGWMAYIHKGQAICNNFKVVETAPPPAEPVFPEWFTLTDPQGKQARYDFARIIE